MLTARIRCASILFCLNVSLVFMLDAQSVDPQSADLQLVVVLSRHGVRSPLGNPQQYNRYSAAPWPKWNAAPGQLTVHGYGLMKLVGSWDRSRLSTLGIITRTGCEEAGEVSIISDSDKRTRDTGHALAEGMFPGCTIEVQSQAESTADPLFRPVEAGISVGETVGVCSQPIPDVPLFLTCLRALGLDPCSFPTWVDLSELPLRSLSFSHLSTSKAWTIRTQAGDASMETI
jgi:hypothetical protein